MLSVSSKNIFMALLISAILFASVLFESEAKAANDATPFVEGRDFVIKFPYEKPKKQQVVEFFSFMCPACFKRETTVLRWVKQKPDTVELLKIPVSFGRNAWALSAKAFYIAEELKIAGEFGKVMFQKIHIHNKPPRRLADIEKIFAEMGVSKQDFTKAEKSFAVSSKLRKADFLVKKYNVPSVPYFLVNFKYEATESATQTEASLFRLWNLLPARDFN